MDRKITIELWNLQSKNALFKLLRDNKYINYPRRKALIYNINEFMGLNINSQASIEDSYLSLSIGRAKILGLIVFTEWMALFLSIEK